MRNLILTMAEHQEQGKIANKAQNNGNQMNPHKTSFHVSIHELRWRWVKSNKYPMEMKTTTKPDFHMMHSETKSRAVSLSNHSKENEEDSSQTWIIKLSTKSSNSQKILRKEKEIIFQRRRTKHSWHPYLFLLLQAAYNSLFSSLATLLPPSSQRISPQKSPLISPRPSPKLQEPPKKKISPPVCQNQQPNPLQQC